MRLVRFFLLLILFGFSISKMKAQDIVLNTPISGSLASGETVTYDFIAREGQMLSFVARADASLDPVLSIQNNNGTVLISNDDYDYPNTRNALIEGFYASYNGSYSLSISAYGDTAGAYELTALSGYSSLASLDNFDSSGNWETIAIAETETPNFNIVNGTANLIQTGIDQAALVTGFNPTTPNYYIDADIESITGGRGWEVGLAFKVQDAENYYRLVINNNGAWQLVLVNAGTETILRDWNSHPAIRAGASSFALGILVNEYGYDIFYDDSYIGSAYDDSLDAGRIGLFVNTANALGSEVTARYESLIVTSPTFVNNAPIFPTQLVASGMNGTIRELERRFLIPVGGSSVFNIPESFAQNNRAGVSSFAMANNASFSNFALGVNVNWPNSGGVLNACGLVLRDDGADNYILAYVDSMGAYGLAERSDTSFIQNEFNERIELQRPPYQLLLIANEGHIDYFINSFHALSLETELREGAVGEAVINFESIDTNCEFNNFWLWQW